MRKAAGVITITTTGDGGMVQSEIWELTAIELTLMREILTSRVGEPAVMLMTAEQNMALNEVGQKNSTIILPEQ